MIPIKSKEDIEKMKEAGAIAKGALNEALEAVEPGISLKGLNDVVEKYIINKGATPGFKTVDDYDFATCINVNEGLVHGIPDDYRLKVGDIVSIDLGAFLDGWHSDLSHTIEIETTKHSDFLKIGEEALKAGIKAFKVGNRLGDVGNAMQKVVEAAGYSVSQDLVGHGIGRELHEEPYVPGYGRPGKGIKIEDGMVFAIEIIYQKGNPDITISDDGWTIETSDKSLSGMFENTVAVVEGNPVVLTK